MRINLPISFLAVFGLLVATHGSNLRSQRFLQQNDEADKADIDPGSTVVGGTAAAGGEFPFFARFGDGSCGGTLVRSIQLTAVLYSIFNCANVVSFCIYPFNTDFFRPSSNGGPLCTRWSTFLCSDWRYNFRWWYPKVCMLFGDASGVVVQPSLC